MMSIEKSPVDTLTKQDLYGYGPRLRFFRRRENLSIEKLSQIIGVTAKSVRSWEHGKNLPSMEHLLQLAELYHCTVDYLVQGERSISGSVIKELPPKITDLILEGSDADRDNLREFLGAFIRIYTPMD